MPEIALAPDDALTRHRAPLHALTGIRFIAAMQAVMFHFGAAFVGRHGAPRIVVDVLRNGFQAVSLFFLLSGFILAYTYAGQMHTHGAVKRFYQARFARIYPAYALSLIAGAILWRPHLPDYLYTFTMTQAWNPVQPWRATALNIPAWTLSVEAVFYLLFPLLLAAALHRRAGWLLTAGLALIAFIVFGHTVVDTDYMMALGANDPRRWIPLPLWRVPEFALGVVTGLLFLRVRHKPIWGGRDTRLLSIMLYTAVVLELALLAKIDLRWGSLLVIPNTVLLFSLAVSSGLKSPPVLTKLLATRTMLLLGGASYSIYLFQLLVRAYLDRFWTGTSTHKEIEIAAAHLALLLGLAVVIFLFYEEPARRVLRRWFAKLDREKVLTKKTLSF